MDGRKHYSASIVSGIASGQKARGGRTRRAVLSLLCDRRENFRYLDTTNRNLFSERGISSCSNFTSALRNSSSKLAPPYKSNVLPAGAQLIKVETLFVN